MGRLPTHPSVVQSAEQSNYDDREIAWALSQISFHLRCKWEKILLGNSIVTFKTNLVLCLKLCF